MALDTTYLHSPKSGIKVPRSGRLPRGFGWGALAQQNGNTWYYVIRKRDGKSIVCQASPCSDEILPPAKLAYALNAEIDKTGK